MRLLLIRHGQCSTADVDDPELTPDGCEQARRLARWLADQRIDRLFASPVLRALQTATIIGGTIGRAVEAWPALAEYHAEVYEVFGAADLAERHPDVRYPPDLPPRRWRVGGETWATAGTRAEGMLADLARTCDPDAHVTLVTHGGFTRCLMRALMGVAQDPQRLDIVVDHTAITTVDLRVHDGAWHGATIVGVNRTPHLGG